MMMKHHTIGMFCAVALLATVSFAVPAHAGFKDTVVKSFNVGRGGTLSLTSDIGSVSVTTGGRDTVKIVVTREIGSGSKDKILRNLDMEFEQHGSDLEIRTEYKRKNHGLWSWLRNNRLKLKYEITVPEEYNLKLKTSGGSIKVDDLDGRAICRTSGGSIKLKRIGGPVDAHTSGGSISLTGSAGDAALKTSGGKITAGDVDGDVDAKTSGGSIHIERIDGSVHARTSGGGITLGDVAGNVDASSSGGSVKASISAQPNQDCRLTTSGGGITVTIDPEHHYSIDAKTSGGGVSSDVPVTVTGNLKRNRLVADMNGGGPALYLRTSGGGIKIRKR
jgi:hypothetical protein